VLRNAISRAFGTLRRHGAAAVLGKTARYARRAYRRLRFSPYIVDKQVAGEHFRFYIGDVFGEEWYVPYDENPELIWIKERLHAGDVFVDCGSHHGMISILASRWVGTNGRVVAFDGLPENIEIVRKNVSLNGATNIESHNIAVGGRNGKVRFARASNGYITERLDKVVEVPMVPLDEFFANRKPHFLKIDVEGYELEVLKGARAILNNFVPTLNIEVHCLQFDRPEESIEAIFKELPGAKYRFEVLPDYGGKPLPYEPHVHTPRFLAKFDKFSLLAMPSS
jgi:FkbM family methyltransferase